MQKLLKLLLVMKLTTLLILAACLQVGATGFSQSITYAATNVPLPAVFNVIEKQTGYTVVYNPDWLDKAKPVSVSATRIPVEIFLTEVLKDQPFDFSIQNTTIILSRKQGSNSIIAKPPVTAPAPPPVQGIIRDDQGKPLAGASITNQTTKETVASDENGAFTINAEKGDILTVTFVGFERAQTKLQSASGTITIALTPANNELDQVQVIAYGTTTKRYNVGNVVTVKAKDIEKQPVTNPLAAIQDKVPGLRIVQMTGVSGGAFKVEIRGKSSIANGNDPLYVIDGVPYTSTLLPSQGAGIFDGNYGTVGNPLNFINMNNIERIDVLKDADATAIYGSRGANGVILITTKKGKPGKMAVDFNLSSSIGKIVKRMDLMNTPQYLQMRRKALANDGLEPAQGWDVDLLNWDTTRYTDWQKEIFGGTAHFTTAQMGISGGTDLTSYNVSGIYSRQTTVFSGQFADTKAGVNVSFSANSPNRRFWFQFAGGYTNDNNRVPIFDLTSTIDLAPNAPKIYNSDGSLNYEDGTFYNPFAVLKVKFNQKTDNLISNFTTGYKIAKGLELKTSFGFNWMKLWEINSTPSAAINPAQASFILRNSSFTDNTIKSWIIEPQLTYTANVWKGKLDALVGATLQSNSTNGELVSGEGYTSDALLDDIKSAPTVRIIGTTAALYRYDALFGRVSYNLLNKYLINLTGRRDGSSRFGPESRFHNFGAIGLGWIFTQENFMKDIKPLSFGKLRASIGWTGNDQVGDYRFLNLYQSYWAQYQNVTGLMLTSPFNPNLQWEVNRKQEIGLELGFLNNRINFSTSFYRNIASKQLVEYPLSFVTGFTGIPYNLDATVENKGWEFLLSTTNIRGREFSWTTTANLTIHRNKLLEYPNLASSPYANTFVIGKPITVQKSYAYAGVDPETGLFQFYDATGKKTINPNPVKDRYVLNDFTPAFYAGLSNNLTYKDFSLDFSLQIVKQKGSYYPFNDVPGSMNHNQPVAMLNSWMKPGDQSPYQQYTTQWGTNAYNSALNVRDSDFRISDASFVRLKNVAISWNLPAGFSKRMHLQRGRVYLQGQNLLTFTKFKGLDPESQSSINIPPLMMLAGGFQLTF